MVIKKWACALAVGASMFGGLTGSALAFTLSLSSSQFAPAPTFNSVSSFQFDIDVAAPLASGVYDNPLLGGVTYSVLGVLNAPTPSGFSAFNLQRTIAGPEFYAQGSSLRFEIASGANLADGLQLSELVGPGPVFVFNGREVDTGRYHPPLLELFGGGTGQIQNSNNMGGVNPSSLQVVNVDFGKEYIVGLTANSASMTLAVPEPSEALMMVAGLLAISAWRRRHRSPPGD